MINIYARTSRICCYQCYIWSADMPWILFYFHFSFDAWKQFIYLDELVWQLHRNLCATMFRIASFLINKWRQAKHSAWNHTKANIESHSAKLPTAGCYKCSFCGQSTAPQAPKRLYRRLWGITSLWQSCSAGSAG